MQRQQRGWWALWVALLVLLAAPGVFARAQSQEVGGELRFRTDVTNGNAPVYLCPLERTDVEADISGMFGRVRVRQVFTNPTKKKIEAMYVFPLPENAAVDQMVMTVGRHRVIGVVKERQEARAVYEAAKAEGKVASLLDQERPNVFTQSVANIEPGAKVVIELSMVQTISFADGVFTWAFPTVVGPRYIPGSAIGQQRSTARLPDTDRVPDASRISPPVVPPTTRAGHSLGLTVHLNTGGLPLTGIKSELHDIDTDTGKVNSGIATVTLAAKDEIPNRDFILHYGVGGAKIGSALFTYQAPEARGIGEDRYFSLLVTPPKRVTPKQIVPKEMVFVIDCSGSMGGFPLEKAKETMRGAILGMNPNDTFNLLAFASNLGKCFSKPVPNTPENREKALKYLKSLNGNGGTEMLPAINEALSGKVDDGRLRVVCFMTDGYIGNEGEIIGTIKKNAGQTRVFAFGIGGSVNRFLLDAMARAGRGAVEYVTLQAQADESVARFRKRIQSPVLTDVKLDFGGLPVYDVYPKQMPDLFDAAPVIVYGRIKGETPSSASITLRGHAANGDYAQKVRLGAAATRATLGDEGIGNDAVVSLWARSKVDDLLESDPMALQGGQTSDTKIKKAVTDLGVQYSLMTPFTSFVAVDDKSYTGKDTADEVSVPVETPEGVSFEGAVGGSGGAIFATKKKSIYTAQRRYGVTASAKSGGTSAPAASSFAAQPGDPLIRITDAPEDTRLIVAVLPDGTTVPLAKDEKTKAWEAHFDIPLSAAEGTYDVKIILVRKTGERRQFVLHYQVDTSGAAASGSVQSEANGAFYKLEIEADEEVARVTALLPNGERVEMSRPTEAGTHYVAHVPAASMGTGAPVVNFILTDRAHNRTTITVDGTK